MFNEKTTEYSKRAGKEVPVWISPQYEASKKKALEIIKKYDTVTEADFWILMNETKSGKMAYTGLIISHNGCLKLNKASEKKFRPECVKEDKDGYKGSLVYTYIDPEQGIYEVGEASDKNCKNDYPYAMAFKRLFDRVVLKLTELAFSGVYSDSEADEFKNPFNEPEKPEKIPASDDVIAEIKAGLQETDSDVKKFLKVFNVTCVDEMDEKQAGKALQLIDKKRGKVNAKR